jgi:hypothetical protein
MAQPIRQHGNREQDESYLDRQGEDREYDSHRRDSRRDDISTTRHFDDREMKP